MARLPRLTLAGQAHHIIQRGNNRQPIFARPGDEEELLGLIRDYAKAEQVAIHAYVLMPNHFHLLATPQTGGGVPRMMQAVGRRYVRRFNDREGRSGSLWEGRFRSSLIDTECYLLTCMAYIDLNPVRAGLVQDAADWNWSSHRHLIGRQIDRLMTPHPLYWGLGNTPFARETAYAVLVAAGVRTEDQSDLTTATLAGWPLGTDAFRAVLQQQTKRRLSRANAGRPVKAAPERAVPDQHQ